MQHLKKQQRKITKITTFPNHFKNRMKKCKKIANQKIRKKSNKMSKIKLNFKNRK